MKPSTPFVLAAALLGPVAAHAATFTVSNTANAGPGSLRQALIDANNAGSSDTIAFAIGGCPNGVCRITLTSLLPTILGPLVIDGYTQPGAVPNTLPAPQGNNAALKVELAINSGFSECLFASATHLTIRGIAFVACTGGAITLSNNTTGLVVEGSWFGVAANGAQGTGLVAIAGGSAPLVARIGGTAPAQRNVFAGTAGNSTSALVNIAGDLTVEGNLFGVAPDGVTPRGLTTAIGPGLCVAKIGGTTAAQSNVFAASTSGIDATFNCAAPELRVHGNRFGVDGNRASGNFNDVRVATSNFQPPAVGAVVVGGEAAGEANLFAASPETSIDSDNSANVSTAGPRVTVRANLMVGEHQGLGIDVGTGGRAPNDAGDDDGSPSNPFSTNVQNFPVISAYTVTGGNASLAYRVDSSVANATYPLRVEFFKADGARGAVPLGRDTYAAAEAQAVKNVLVPIPAGVSLGADDVIVATATDANGTTGEFSFLPVALTVLPLPASFLGVPYTVRVRAVSNGPFKPNGEVFVLQQRGAGDGLSCIAALVPTATANTSEGECQLTSTGASAFTEQLVATYKTDRGAFGSASGANVTANGSVALTSDVLFRNGFE